MSIVEKIKLQYPLPIAKLHEEMRLVTVPTLRVYKLLNLFEGTVQYMTLLGLAQYRRQQMMDADVEQLRLGLSRPSLGHWVHLMRGLSKCLRPTDPKFLTTDPMRDYKDEPIGACIRILREVLGMDTLKKVQLHHFLDTMIEFRNKKKGHGELFSAEADQLMEPLENAINQWLDGLSPLFERHLVYVSEIKLTKGSRLCTGTKLNIGTSLDTFQTNDAVGVEIDECVYLYQPDSDTYLSLWPFMVYKPDSQLLYSYHELTDQGDAHLRCLYSTRGTEGWITLSVDKRLIFGEQAASEAASSVVPDQLEARKSEKLELVTLPETENHDSSPPPMEAPAQLAELASISKSPSPLDAEPVFAQTSRISPETTTSTSPITDDLANEGSPWEKGRIQQKIEELEKITNTLDKKVGDLWQEWVTETRDDEKDRLRTKIKKATEQQADVEADLKDLHDQLHKLEALSQREMQKIKQQSEVHQSRIGLDTLKRIMQNPQVHAVIVRSSGNFDQARRQIDIMQDYKHIHDSLHDLEFECFRPISPHLPHFPGKVDFGELSYYLLKLSQIRKRIQDIVTRASFPQSEDPLLKRLEDAERTLSQALKTRNRELFDRALRSLAQLLRIDRSRINQRLSNAAASLSLPALIKSMEQVRDHLIEYEYNPVETNAIDNGIQSLRNLDNSLASKTREHSEWQELNDELELAESDMQSAIDQWPHVKERLAHLCGNSQETLVIPIRELCEDLGHALQTNEPKRKLKELFRNLNRVVGMRFQEIDLYLKDFYDEVRGLDEPLTSIVHQIMQ